MAYAEARTGYWRGRYRVDGRLQVVKDELGEEVRFSSQRAAKQAATDAEVRARDARVALLRPATRSAASARSD